MRKNKQTVKMYYCKKCGISKYIITGQEFDGVCKCCKQIMDFEGENEYRPNNGLKAINDCNTNSLNSEFVKPSKPTISCPYCKSTNTKKISATERVASIAMLGIFSRKINKSFKCNNCGGTF